MTPEKKHRRSGKAVFKQSTVLNGTESRLSRDETTTRLRSNRKKARMNGLRGLQTKSSRASGSASKMNRLKTIPEEAEADVAAGRSAGEAASEKKSVRFFLPDEVGTGNVAAAAFAELTSRRLMKMEPEHGKDDLDANVKMIRERKYQQKVMDLTAAQVDDEDDEEVEAEGAMATWTCPREGCDGAENENDESRCARCGKLRPSNPSMMIGWGGTLVLAQIDASSAGWSCKTCTLSNASSNDTCIACQESRYPETAAPAATATAESSNNNNDVAEQEPHVGASGAAAASAAEVTASSAPEAAEDEEAVSASSPGDAPDSACVEAMV